MDMTQCNRCYYGLEFCICKQHTQTGAPLPVQPAAVSQTERPSGVFERSLVDGALECAICDMRIGAGKNQQYERAYHGHQHAVRGEVIERHDSKTGALFFLLKDTS